MSRSGAWRGALGAAALLVAVTIATASRADQERVGVTAAVNPHAVGHTTPSESRALFVGANVLYKERIVTTDSGQAQILFLDQSALTVAPNSDITIDQFVYDPDKKAGKLAATVSKGILRFVGGRISKQSDVTFNTPTATIGVRGGVLMIHVDPNGVTRATFLFGNHMTVTSGGVTRIVTRPNFSVTVQLPNQPPGSPTPTPQQLLTETLHALEGSTSQSGGASQIPTDTKVALVNLTQTLMNSDPTTFVVTSGTNNSKTFIAPIPDLVQNTQNDANQHTAQQATSTNTTSNQQNDNTNTGNTNTGNTGGNNTPTPTPTPTIKTFSLSQDSTLQSNMPFVPKLQNGNNANASVSPLYMAVRSTGGIGDGDTSNERTTGLQASLVIDGQGASQVLAGAISTFVVGIDGSTGSPLLSGHMVAVGFGNPEADSEHASEPVNAYASITSKPGTSPLSASTTSFDIDNKLVDSTFTRTTTPDAKLADLPDDDFVNPNYSFTHTASQTTTPTGVGTNRTAQTLVGYAAAVFSTFDNSETASPVLATNSSPGDISIATMPSLNQLSAQFNLATEDTSLNHNQMVLNFGRSTTDSTMDPSRSAFIDDNIFAALEQRKTDGTLTSTYNGVTFVDAHLAMVTSDLVQPAASFFPAGVSFCQCQYLKWGYWLGDASIASSNIGLVSLGTWVAGPMADLVSFNAQAHGQAVYTGHAIGNVFNNGANYMAVGKFTNNWDFGARQGTVSITSFDGITGLSGTATAPTDPRNYSVTNISAHHPTAGNVTATINGSFFKSPTDVAAETGGNFTIKGGTTYRAAGIFAAKK